MRRQGATISVAQLFDLARRWYDDRLDGEWQRRTPQERQSILAEVGLLGPAWEIPGGTGI